MKICVMNGKDNVKGRIYQNRVAKFGARNFSLEDFTPRLMTTKLSPIHITYDSS